MDAYCQGDASDDPSPQDSTDRGLEQSVYNIQVPLRHGRSLAFNSISQQLLVLAPEERAYLDSGMAPSALPEASRRALSAAGFLVPAGTEETSEIGSRFEAKRRHSGHLNVTIAATLNCNLACGYCFQGQNKPSARMSDSVQEGLIAYVRSRLADLQSVNVTWYGGEPLMNQKEIWRTSSAIRDLCAEKGAAYTSLIVTNGYLLTAEVARKLVEHGVVLAQVTIDGVGDEHDRMRPHISGRGTFDRIVANVEDVLANSTLAISLRISVDTENSGSIVDLLHFLAERNLQSSGRLNVYFAPIEAISSGCTDYEPLSLSKQKYAQLEVELLRLAVSLGLKTHTHFAQDAALCQAVRVNDLVITPKGDLHKCWDTVSFDRLKVANISDPRAAELLSDNHWLDWKAVDNPVCRACKILPICGGGCAHKTINPAETAGEGASLPCISLKFNLAERLFQVALASGACAEDDWDPESSPTLVDGQLKTGARHTYSTMRAASAPFAPKPLENASAGA